MLFISRQDAIKLEFDEFIMIEINIYEALSLSFMMKLFQIFLVATESVIKVSLHVFNILVLGYFLSFKSTI